MAGSPPRRREDLAILELAELDEQHVHLGVAGALADAEGSGVHARGARADRGE